jgi:hypothetical protein
LAQTSLASLLEAMQSERATGTLAVTNGDTSCSLYFLFGHLFHAAGSVAEGEEAVIEALAWPDGQFTFDPRAKLPAEETIKSATSDLLAEAERRRALAANNGSANPADPAAAAPPDGTAAAGPYVAPPPVAESKPEPAPAPSKRETAGPPVMGNPDAPPLSELYPLPAGKAMYEGLKSAFVDFPKLLRTLEGDKLTGYVRLSNDAFSGVLLLHDGHVLEALFGEGGLDQGLDAFHKVRLKMERGEGLLDVIELSGETVVALAQLLTARPMFTGLLGRFINFDSLLEYLNEEKVDGSLVVAGGSEMGVILLRKGNVHGAYTHSKRELQSSAQAVSDLAQERTSRIEVRAGAGSPAGIDVAAALRGT